MISRYVPMGLLCILLFFSCNTINIKENTIEDEDPVPLLIEEFSSNPQKLLEKILELDSKYQSKYSILISRLYLSLGEYINCEDSIQTIPQFESSVECLEILSICEYSQGRDATDLLEQLIALDITNSIGNKLLINTLISSRDLENAEKILKTYFENGGHDDFSYIALGDIALVKVENLGLEKKKVLSSLEEKIIYGYYKDALENYKKIESSNDPSYYVKLSNIYKKLGKRMDAVEAMSVAIQLEPQNEWNYYDRGRLYFYLDAPERAKKDFLSALNINPDHFFSNIFLGRLYFMSGENTVSKKYYLKALEITPDYLPAYKDLSVLFMVEGDNNTGLKYLKKLYNSKSDPDELLPLYLVDSLINNNEMKEAQNLLEKLVKYEKNSTMKRLYQYYLSPSSSGDQILNDILHLDNNTQRLRLTYYVASILEREGVKFASSSLFGEVRDSYNGFESMLSLYKLGEINE
ncbi:MAG: hypothetical protein JXR64_05755 [Spirochaetales bacterium]|nr:hypothetical protein [Spirochaetales bacterium]